MKPIKNDLIKRLDAFLAANSLSDIPDAHYYLLQECRDELVHLTETRAILRQGLITLAPAVYNKED